MQPPISFSRFLALLVFAGLLFTGRAQTDTSGSEPFYLYLTFSGMGSNRGHRYPVLRIRDTGFIYTKEQTSGFGDYFPDPDTLLTGTFPQSAIDSITDLVKAYHHSEIFRSNNCIMSGGIYHLSIARGTDTVRFTMMNTFDYLALKITTIIDHHISLPAEQRLWYREELILEEERCRKYRNG